MEAVEIAKQFVTIPDSDVELIMHCKTAYLRHNGSLWAKKGRNNFDLTIGVFDGAEAAELVGLMSNVFSQELEFIGMTALQSQQCLALK